MKKVTTIEDYEELLDREVKAWGNTAHIPIDKKHIGKPVVVIVGGKYPKKK